MKRINLKNCNSSIKEEGLSDKSLETEVINTWCSVILQFSSVLMKWNGFANYFEYYTKAPKVILVLIY